jgi:DNA-binding LacI/PurR family transcriptional regulator
MAVGLTKAAAESGLRVPQDLLITGVDDFSISKTSHPPLTTYHVPYNTMGQRAFEVLQSLVARTETGGEEVLVRGKIVVRESA